MGRRGEKIAEWWEGYSGKTWDKSLDTKGSFMRFFSNEERDIYIQKIIDSLKDWPGWKIKIKTKSKKEKESDILIIEV